MDSEQPSFTDIEYGNRAACLASGAVPGNDGRHHPVEGLGGLIEPHYYADRPGKRGRKAKPVETMLRMYLLQVWFSLSDEGVEEAIYDSYAMRRFMGLDFAVEQVPDATTLLHFCHLLEKHWLGEAKPPWVASAQGGDSVTPSAHAPGSPGGARAGHGSH